MRFSDLPGRRVVVWGYGLEGRSVVDHCRTLGVDVTAAEPDLSDGPERGTADGAQVAGGPGVAYGEQGRTALLGADVVVKSPGVPVVAPLYRELADRGVPVTSLTDLWLADHAVRTVAVTGTKGKSTTAALITHLLSAAGLSVDLRGNIGTSLLDEPDPPSEVVVMELSSYQAQTLTVSPRIVVVTSLFPEHLTWHGSVEAYYRDKLNAVAHDPAVVVLPEGDEALEARVRDRLSPAAQLLRADATTVHVDDAGDLVWADGTRVPADRLPLGGRHQAVNTALACVVASLHGAEPAVVAAAVQAFTPLAHRMETVPSTDGRRWIDDGLATAPEAVVAALQSLGDQPVSVIIGGQDRGLDYVVLVDFLRSHPQVRPLLIGAVGARLADQVEGQLFPGFGAAVAWARSAENPDPVVLLSPGAPSFDEFRNYQERSASFRAAAAGSS